MRHFLLLLTCATLVLAACKGAEEAPAAVGEPAAKVADDQADAAAPAKAQPVADPAKVDAAGDAAAADAHDHDGECTCGLGKEGGTVWCEHCGSGYIKGVKSSDKDAVLAALKEAAPASD